jgi:hypothetical protein
MILQEFIYKRKAGKRRVSISPRLIYYYCFSSCIFGFLVYFFFTRTSCKCPDANLLPTEIQLMSRQRLISKDSLDAYKKTPKKKAGLLTMAVGLNSGKAVDTLLYSFPKKQFDIILFHYHAKDSLKKWIEKFNWALEDHIHHIFDPNLLKLNYARKYLKPTLTNNYDYIFLWDEDGIIPDISKMSWGSKTIDFFRENKIDMGGPTFTAGSHVTYGPSSKYSYLDEKIRPVEFVVEIGFQIWGSEAWMYAHKILVNYPFRLWYFDALPWKCIASGAIKKLAYMNTSPISHVRKPDETRLPLNTDTIANDLRYRNEIVKKFGCCYYFQKLRLTSKVTRKDQGVEMLSCDLSFPEYLL